MVHLDLKGAPPKISYYEQIFPIVSSFGATGLLVEYEDMFPYHGKLAHLKAPHAYTQEDISKIHELAAKSNLTVIPLIQTFGHFEFVLKHDENRALREIEGYPNSLCPTHPDTFPLVTELLTQVVSQHLNDKYIHIGADEVWHIGKCPRCQVEMASKAMTTDDIFQAWIIKVVGWIKKEYPHLVIIMWDDMMRNISTERIKSSGIGDLVEPMVWQYQAKAFDLPSDLFERYAAVFQNIWVASAFKGATGSTQFLPPIQHHINNNLMWMSILSEKKHINKFKGIALTGWQRYDHYAVLCELLPVALPSLCLCLRVVSQAAFTEADHDYVSQKMGFHQRISVLPFPRPQVIEQQMSFPGHKIYVGVQMWSNFVCRYQAISNSEGMLGWFSDYLRSRNFTNPLQVETILTQIVEVLDNILELKTHFVPWLQDVFFEDTVEEWVGCYIDPLVDKLNDVIKECKKQILIGGRVRDYKKAQIS